MSSSTTLLGLLGDKSYKIWSQNHTSNNPKTLNIKVNQSLY